MKYYSMLVGILLSANGFAWDGAVSGKVRTIDVTGGNNYGFRIALEGSPKLCGNENSWAFINVSDSNYQTYVAVLLAAKAAQFDVRVYTNRTSDENGYCRIGYIAVR